MNYKTHIENFLSNNTNSFYLSKEEVYEKSKKKPGFFSSNVWYSHRKYIENNDLKDEVLMGWDLGLNFILFTKSEILVTRYNNDNKSDVTIFPIEKFEFLKLHKKSVLSHKISLDGIDISSTSYPDIFKKQYNEISSLLFEEKNRIEKEKMKEILNRIQVEKERKNKEKKERDRIEKEKWLNREEELRIQEIKRKEVLKKDISDVSKEFDTDSDGIIDFNQGQDDFMNLLKKHQGSIIENDQNHITKFIQVSNYLKTKRENIQKQFEKIKSSKNSNQLKEFIGVLKNQIDTFNLLSYNSMIMIISLVEKDLITFNEIYLTFDKLNIFNSNWENEVSNKLGNIDSKLDDLIFSINKMETSITNEILKMSIMSQINMNRLNKSVSHGNMMINDSLKGLNSSLSSNLKSIGSKMNLNNVLTGINTYQLYKLNKNTRSLRS